MCAVPTWLKILALSLAAVLLSAGSCADDAGRTGAKAVRNSADDVARNSADDVLRNSPDDVLPGARRTPVFDPPSGTTGIKPVEDSIEPAVEDFAETWGVPEGEVRDVLLDVTCDFLWKMVTGEPLEPPDMDDLYGLIGGRSGNWQARRAAAIELGRAEAIKKGEEFDRNGEEIDFAVGEACSAAFG